MSLADLIKPVRMPIMVLMLSLADAFLLSLLIFIRTGSRIIKASTNGNDRTFTIIDNACSYLRVIFRHTDNFLFLNIIETILGGSVRAV